MRLASSPLLRSVLLGLALGGCATAETGFVEQDSSPADSTPTSDASGDRPSADTAHTDVRASEQSTVDATGADASRPDGTVPSDVATTPDVPTVRDVTTPLAPLYSICRSDADCGTGSSCLTAYPGGLCTRPCTGTGAAANSMCRGPSAEPGFCAAGTLFGLPGAVCLPGCTTTPQGATTPPPNLMCNRWGGSCNSINGVLGGGPSDGLCLPACFPAGTTRPAGEPTCAAGLVCDPYASPLNGACVTTLAATTHTANGGTCTADTDCNGGQCLLEVDPMTGPSGWLGGYCLSRGRQPPASLEVRSTPWPQYNCPTGTVPYLFVNEGDNVGCFKQCSTNADCRAGYLCDHATPTGMPTVQFFTTGACFPTDCLATGTPRCPSGYRCVALAGTSPAAGRCER